MPNCHRPTHAFATAAVLFTVAAVGCSVPVAPEAAAPGAAFHAKGGNGGGGGGGSGSSGGSISQGDLTLAAGESPALATTCPSSGFTRDSWALVFGKSGCLIVSPLWASTAYEAYQLADDLVLNIQRDGRKGPITHVRLVGQDVDGPDGIWHNTDWIPVAVPVVPQAAGFTLHVHAKNVGVWRYDSHLGGGNRVEMIGTISIGDVIYPAQ